VTFETTQESEHRQDTKAATIQPEQCKVQNNKENDIARGKKTEIFCFWFGYTQEQKNIGTMQ
jgi:hypothetical protein